MSTLLTRNLHDVFGENDPARRRAAINEIFTEDCVFYEPRGVHHGRDEIDRVAGAIKATHPDFRYQPIAAPEELGNGGRVQWVSGRPGEAPSYAGTDFIIARDGRIAAVYLFFDKLPDVKEAHLAGTDVSIRGTEAIDRLQIRELVDAYADCADRRDAKGQLSLFTEDTHFVVFLDAKSEKPSIEFNRREDLAAVFADLNKYEVTTHFMGQSTLVLDGNRATGETYCIAHHVSASEGKRTLFIASLRYYDVFAKVKGKWLFAERKLMVDWTDTRPIN
jgi:ketosteroid isomerase-like protein